VQPLEAATMNYNEMVERIIAEAERDLLIAQAEARAEARGILRGELRATRLLLQLLLTSRFGDVPSEIMNYIDYIHDPERLQIAFRQALTLEKVHDLRI
jgi:hypothetical protein